MDAALIGSCRVGNFRVGVRDYSLWDSILAKIQNIATCDVTRRKLVLGAPDDTTGWYPKRWTESTIQGKFDPRNVSSLATVAGTYVRRNEVFYTADPLEEGDEIQTASNIYYEVKGMKPYYLGDSFYYREAELTLLPLHGLTYSDLSPSVNDARYQTKLYWDTYISDSNLNNHSYLMCYANPDYPVTRVFKDKAIDIIFAVDQPNSTPLIGHHRSIDAYEEHVPTHVLTLETQLQWLAEAELRRIVEDQPEGSYRALERRNATIHEYGSTRVFDTEFLLSYRRLK